MFFIFFGAMWLSITGVITFAMYSAPTVSVNGQPVTADQFDAMLAPKLFLGIFWLIGIGFLVVGIRKLVIDTMTRVKGELAIGMVVDILETGTYSNGRPEWKAKVMVAMEDGTLKEFSEVIGYDANKYSMGEYLEVKYYKKDNLLFVETECFLLHLSSFQFVLLFPKLFHGLIQGCSQTDGLL